MNYFDHASSTLPYNLVLDLHRSFSKEIFANASAKHKLGRNLNESKNRIQQFILTNFFNSNGDILFPHSATLANNMAILGLDFKEGDEILAFSGDHPSLYKPVLEQQKKKNVIFKDLDLNDFFNDGDLLIEKLTLKTKLVCLTSVNNQSGLNFNAIRIAEKIREKFPLVKIHLDASQSFSKLFEDYQMFDSVTFSSHKLGGLKGIAGLYLKNKELYSSLFFGGGQQFGLYSGTEDVSALLLLEKALKMNLDFQKNQILKVERMREEIIEHLKSLMFGFQFPFEKNMNSPFILTVICPHLSSDIIIRLLEEKNVYLSSTAACSSRIVGTNNTFLKLDIPKEFHKNVIRISLSFETEEKEISAFKEAIKEVCEENRFLIKMKR